jgi:arylsulfatase A-like enzyme
MLDAKISPFLRGYLSHNPAERSKEPSRPFQDEQCAMKATRFSSPRAIFLATTILILVPLTSLPADHQVAERPNIIFLLTDDQRWDTLGCMGNEAMRTPAIDRLAAEGVLFRNAFVTTSVCSVSRTSIITGQFARSRGIGDLVKMDTPISWEDTLPALLRKAGYYTGHIGKWDIGVGEAGFQKGVQLFDYWGGDRFHGNHWHEHNCPFVMSDGVTLKEDIQCTCPPNRSMPRTGHRGMKQPLHTDSQIVPMKARQFLTARESNKPFYLSISFRGPKDPWGDAPADILKQYEGVTMPKAATANLEAAASLPEFIRQSMGSKPGRDLVSHVEKLDAETRKYACNVSALDAAVGSMRQLLAALGLADNTVIIFTADNGMMIGDHGLRGKWLPYDSSIRVPLIVHDPRQPSAHRGNRRDQLVLNIDLAPTILSLAGCKVPAAMQGRDFTPLLSGAPVAWRDDFYYEHSWTAEGRIPANEALRTREWKLMRFPGEEPPVEQLFHLKEDPHEQRDVITLPENDSVLAQLRARLNVLRKEAETPPTQVWRQGTDTSSTR